MPIIMDVWHVIYISTSMYFVFGLAALVPFEGLSEPNLQRHYQLKPDEEITRYAEEASTVKKVNSEACLLLQQMQNHIFLILVWNFLDPCLGIWKDLAIQSMHIFRTHQSTNERWKFAKYMRVDWILFLGDDVLWVFAGESDGKILLGRSQGQIGQSCCGNPT